MMTTTLLALLLFLGHACGAVASEDCSIRLSSPEPEHEWRYTSWPMSVSVEVIAPPGDYEVELFYNGVTHYLTAFDDRGYALEGGKKRWNLSDQWLYPELGKHDLELRLLSLEAPGVGAAGRRLAECRTQIEYVLSTETPPEEQARKTLRQLANAAITWAKVLDPIEAPYQRDGHSDLEHRRRLADEWLTAKSKWLHQRVETLAKIAELYDYTGRPGDGLRALKRAEAIWKGEASRVLHRTPAPAFPIKWHPGGYVYAPAQHRVRAGFYARRMELDRAVESLKQAIAFMDEQQAKHPYLTDDDRKICGDYKASLMHDIARMHYILRRDRAGYDLWMKRSKKARGVVDTREGGLLGQ
mgnify:CR=1 FL=1